MEQIKSKTMEKREIVYRDGSYQILKQRENGSFFPWGERKSLKALADMYKGKNKKFNLVMPPEIEQTITGYIQREEIRQREYRINNELESKTI